MNYITGDLIKKLREQKKLTQQQLAEKIYVTDKAISKWENNRGLPDISIIPTLAKALNVSVVELFTGNITVNVNKRADVRKSKLYVCPVCGNVIHSMGEGSFSCCGVMLLPFESEPSDENHFIDVSESDGELFVQVKSKMTKDDYVSFIACVNQDSIQIKKLYPEENAQARFQIKRDSIIYAYYNRDGLFAKQL